MPGPVHFRPSALNPAWGSGVAVVLFASLALAQATAKTAPKTAPAPATAKPVEVVADLAVMPGESVLVRNDAWLYASPSLKGTKFRLLGVKRPVRISEVTRFNAVKEEDGIVEILAQSGGPEHCALDAFELSRHCLHLFVRKADLAPVLTRDVAKARDYMAKAGLKTLDLTMDIQDTTEYRTWAEIAQQNLKDIGVNLTINPMDSSSFWSIGDGDKGVNVELFALNYSMEPDPSWAPVWFTCKQVGVWNWMRWCSKAYDDLYNQSLTTTDNTARAQIFVQMEKLWNDAAHSIWITHGVIVQAYTPNIKPATTPNGEPQVRYFDATQ